MCIAYVFAEPDHLETYRIQNEHNLFYKYVHWKNKVQK